MWLPIKFSVCSWMYANLLIVLLYLLCLLYTILIFGVLQNHWFLTGHGPPTNDLWAVLLQTDRPSTTAPPIVVSPTDLSPTTDLRTTEHQSIFSAEISFYKVFTLQHSKYQKKQWSLTFFLHLCAVAWDYKDITDPKGFSE